jgi:hypothetical protein
MSTPDRLEELARQNQVTGIDFIYVHENQVTLDVHFFKPLPGELDQPLVDLTEEQLEISSHPDKGKIPLVPVKNITWINNNTVMRLETESPGDFTMYRLHIDDDRIDPHFNDVEFSFKANCESDLDCLTAEHECPPEEAVDFPVDYQARDFWSFRRALLDFASQRYPDWKDRLEADAGIMLAEVMSALGDELAYYQDRVAREAYLETATQRRSVRRLAKLVDYDVHDGLGASTWLDVTVETGAGNLPAGMDVWAVSESQGRIVYEIGRGLDDIIKKQPYNVDAKRNTFLPHKWDEDDTCLGVGTTEMYIKGHHKTNLKFDDPPDKDKDKKDNDKLPGKWVLLKTNPTRPDLPVRKWLVRLIKVENDEDPVFGEDITRITWEDSQALPFEMDLTILEIHGNIVPATAGRTMESYFSIGVIHGDSGLPEEAIKNMGRAVEREGRDNTVTYLFSLEATESEGLVWLGENPESAIPEIRLIEFEYDGAGWQELSDPELWWRWRRSFLGTNSSQANERHFTLEDGTWKRIAGYQRSGKEIVHVDYASGTGKTIRLGDGEFGKVPPSERTVFKVIYRVGNGSRANVPADTLTRFMPLSEEDEKLLTEIADPIDPENLEAITNPLPVENGIDAEDLDTVRKLAPYAFRAITYRAVRPLDYAKAAERLEWVQRAGASFRWTGSWMSAFVTPDPSGAVTVTLQQYRELKQQMDRFRQAGREVIVKNPQYADIDLEITVCAAPTSFQGEVKEKVLEELLGKGGVRAQAGFFSPDNFTFGSPLQRSVLEAVIQAIPGVRAVKKMVIRRRGWHDWQEFRELTYPVAVNEIIRLENNPLHPERGSLKIKMEGGA